MFFGVLDKTIMTGYLLHCDVVRFFSVFSITVHHYFGHHTIKTSRNHPDTYFGKFNNTRVSMTFTCGKSSNSGLEKKMKIMETLRYRAGVIMN